jgi:hypothetical protein
MSDKVTKVKDFIKELEALSKKQKDLNVHIEEQNFRTCDSFFNTNDHIFDSSERWFENVSIDRTKWLKHWHPTIQTDFDITEVPWVEDIVNEFYEDEDVSKVLPDEKFTLDNIKAHKEFGKTYQELMDRIYNELEDKDYNELEEHMEQLYGIGCPEEAFNEIEALAYWTVYFKPVIWDEDVAWKVGLIPFEYDDENYLALGGCGMDLSPKLDAYQALTDDSVPRSSLFLKDDTYAKYVVGETIYNEVMEKIGLDVPILHINFY